MRTVQQVPEQLAFWLKTAGEVEAEQIVGRLLRLCASAMGADRLAACFANAVGPEERHAIVAACVRRAERDGDREVIATGAAALLERQAQAAREAEQRREADRAERERKAALELWIKDKQRAAACFKVEFHPGVCSRCHRAIAGWDVGPQFLDVCPPCTRERIASRNAPPPRSAEERQEAREAMFRPALRSLPAIVANDGDLEWDRLAKFVAAPAAIAAARRVPDLPAQTVFVALMGGSKSGKTTLACALMRSIVASGMREDATREQRDLAKGARFVDASVLAEALARFDRDRTEENKEIIASAKDSPFLVLDDLGQEVSRVAEHLRPLLCERHTRGLRTIITTGLKRQDLLTRYSAAVVRRATDTMRAAGGDGEMIAMLIPCGPTDSTVICTACSGWGCTVCSSYGVVKIGSPAHARLASGGGGGDRHAAI